MANPADHEIAIMHTFWLAYRTVSFSCHTIDLHAWYRIALASYTRHMTVGYTGLRWRV